VANGEQVPCVAVESAVHGGVYSAFVVLVEHFLQLGDLVGRFGVDWVAGAECVSGCGYAG
jgi:hypothetical protein